MNEIAADISHHIWATKYRYAYLNGRERTIAETWRRVASTLAVTEPQDSAVWEERFCDILKNFKFLPGGRIQAGAGTAHNVTLFNCFVMGTIEDSIPGIFRALQEGAVTMQQGGGIVTTSRPFDRAARGRKEPEPSPPALCRSWTYGMRCAALFCLPERGGAP